MMPLKLANVVAGVIGSGAVLPAASNYGRKAVKAFGVLVAAGALAFVAIAGSSGFLLAALWAAIRPQMGPVVSPLILAAVLAVLAVFMVVVARQALQPKPKPNIARAGTVQPDAALADVEDIIRKQKLPVLLGAVLIGLFAGGQKR